MKYDIYLNREINRVKIEMTWRVFTLLLSVTDTRNRIILRDASRWSKRIK